MRFAEKMKKCLGILLALVMLLQYTPATVFAATSDTPISADDTVIVTSAPEVNLPDNDGLFAGYVDEQLYGCGIATMGTKAKANLNDVEKVIYDALKARIEAVAAGGGSTVFSLSNVAGLKTKWTNSELGIESIENTAAIEALFEDQFNLENIVSALLRDCPFDLYWYDKTGSGGVIMDYSISRSGRRVNGVSVWTSATVTDLTFTFTVASGYRDGSSAAVTTNVTKVNIAKDEAAEIVAMYQNKTDYEKLVGYKTEICKLVSYNDDAASDSYAGGYGDPWQLIYVFDGDESTTVVCEGYSKAFQYLCDLGGLDCISVTGQMESETGTGGHMWNIVTLDGENYLVDVTNCDEGTVGAPDKLFLVGTPDGDPEEGYTFAVGAKTVFFTYDTESISTWTTAELTLATTDYEVPPQDTKGDLNLDGKVNSDDLTLLARHVGGIESVAGQALANSDVTGDGKVDSEDLTWHARYVAGIITDDEEDDNMGDNQTPPAIRP